MQHNQKKRTIAILGGGNVGTLLAADIARNSRYTVRIFTSRPGEWDNYIDVLSRNGDVKYTSRVDLISNDPAQIISDSDIVISTLPSHVFLTVYKRIAQYIKPETCFGFMPGSGGGELFCKDLIKSGNTVFGFQRVHGIARLQTYGKSVFDLGKKEELFIAAIPSSIATDISAVLKNVLSIPCTPLPNYLNLTLTPSNPILHTSRLYSLFRNYKEGEYWENDVDFYGEWTDHASQILFECDAELQSLCENLNEIDTSGVRSLKDHYESDTPQKLTKKIRSIKAFENIKAPMEKVGGGFVPDYNSRYFKEDFSYGLCIIKGFCELLEIRTPAIDKVLTWYEKIANVRYFESGKFTGRDLKQLPIPQNFDFTSAKDVYRFYK